MDTEKMTPEEINVAVATEVMEWKWDDAWGCLIPPEQQAKPGDMWSEWKIDDDGSVYREPIKGNIVSHLSYNGDFSKVNLPRYDTDIAAAMLVVEKIVEMGYYVDIGIDSNGAQVQLDRLDNEWELNVESTRARTLPLAISRAALAAVEQAEEKR